MLQALVFPVQQSLTLVPNQTGAVLTFSIANFAGAPIQVILQASSLPAWMALSLESDVVQNGDMVSFNITVDYPTASRRRTLTSSCGVSVPVDAIGPDALLNVSMGLSAWRLPKGTTAQSLPSVVDSVKVAVPLQTQTINMAIITEVGDPSALYSCIIDPSEQTNCTVGDTVNVAMELRDAGGALIPFSAAVARGIGLSASCSITGVCRQIISGSGLATVISILNTTDDGVYSVTIRALATGPLLIQMSVNQANVGLPIPLNVSAITCSPNQVTLDGISCVCVAGYYLPVSGNSLACAPCPVGTHNPSPGGIGSVA